MNPLKPGTLAPDYPVVKQLQAALGRKLLATLEDQLKEDTR